MEEKQGRQAQKREGDSTEKIKGADLRNLLQGCPKKDTLRPINSVSL